MTPSTGEKGFALIETVIAAAIIAMILGVTYQTVESARRAAETVESRRLAMLQARSVLAEVGATIPLVPGSTYGTSAAWNWRVDIAPQPGEARDQSIPIDRVVVAVQDGTSRDLVRLETLRLSR